jgi:uroporphyrinogen-III decarboxylase
MCRDAGVLSHLHICGRSWKLVEIVAAETDVDVMEPMEEPPGGDVDIAEAKRRVGDKLCIKGNINTFDFMLNATPLQVEEKCKKLIDVAATRRRIRTLYGRSMRTRYTARESF